MSFRTALKRRLDRAWEEMAEANHQTVPSEKDQFDAWTVERAAGKTSLPFWDWQRANAEDKRVRS